LPSADHGLLSPLWATSAVAELTSDDAVVRAVVAFEAALARATAPAHGDGVGVAAAITAAAEGIDVAALAAAGVADGNPVIGLVARLRAGLDDAAAAWVHRGATSQDALDTALVLVAKAGAERIAADAADAARLLLEHADAHRGTVIVGRTLTQPATPTTLGLKLAGIAHAIAGAARSVRAAAAALPVQLGGAAGTLAALEASGADGVETVERVAADLGLAVAPAPWHVLRAPVTRLGDALVTLTDALGTLGRNVAVAARTGELDDGAAGGSSTMPHKSNPVRAVLLVSAATQAPFLGAALHAAAITVDERPDGAWHAEWQPFRTLLRTAGGAAETAAALARDLRVDTAAIAQQVADAAADLLAERASFADEPAAAPSPADYLGAAGRLTDRLIAATREALA
jgi:3-carboxy-cis,cis-muconate cycloisomerase